MATPTKTPKKPRVRKDCTDVHTTLFEAQTLLHHKVDTIRIMVDRCIDTTNTALADYKTELVEKLDDVSKTITAIEERTINELIHTRAENSEILALLRALTTTATNAEKLSDEAVWRCKSLEVRMNNLQGGNPYIIERGVK